MTLWSLHLHKSAYICQNGLNQKQPSLYIELPKFYICKSRKWNMCTEAVRNVSSVQITFLQWISLSHFLILLVNWKWLLWTFSFDKSTQWVGTTAPRLLKVLYPRFKNFPVHKVRKNLFSLRRVVVLGTRVYEQCGGGNQGGTTGEKVFCSLASSH